MARRHPLDGIVKLASRAAWRADFERVIDEHLGAVCSEFDLEIDELPDHLGQEAFFSLWTCVVEDLAAREFDGRNIIDEYLKRRGWKETARGRAYLKALRESSISLYEVSDIRRGEGFVARDLLRGGEPVRIEAKDASIELVEWDRIGARVVKVGDTTRLTEGLLCFERNDTEEVIAAAQEMLGTPVEDMAAELRRLAEEAAAEDEDAGAFFEAMQGRENELVASMRAGGLGFLLSSEWLRQTLGRMLHEGLPELVDSDGEPIEGISVNYPLQAGATEAKVIEALERIPGITQEAQNLWRWIEDVAKPEAEPEDGTTLLGLIMLQEATLSLAVISASRASRGRALVEGALGDLLGEPVIETQSVEEMVAGAAQREAADTPAPLSDIPQEKRQETARGFFEQHYARALDEPVMELEDRIPRELARSDEDRPKVVEWLKGVENYHARRARDDPAYQVDCGWMWKELGLEAYRRP